MKKHLGSNGVMARRLVRYAASSAAALAISQATLAVSYGLFQAPVPVAVALALVVSLWPSYELNRRFVWTPGTRAGGVSEFLAFLAVGVAGAALTAVLAGAGEHMARVFTTDRVQLTAAVNTTAFSTAVLVWLGRFVVLDRWLFRRRAHARRDVRPPLPAPIRPTRLVLTKESS